MKILFLTDNFAPERNAPASRTFEHAREWVRAGHEVTVITTAPNFPEGRVYAGYRNRWRSVEWLEGIKVVRVMTYISANEGSLRRILDYLSFMVTGGLAALFGPRPDVLVSTSPQFFCAVAGWVVSRLRRLPWVLEIRDLWPASIVALGAMRRSLGIRLLEKLELRMYRDADRVVVVTNGLRDDLVKRAVDFDKIDVVRNGVDLERYQPQAKDADLVAELKLENCFVAGYLGTIGLAHALDKVVAAADLLRENRRIVFLIAGAGAMRAQIVELAARLNLPNLRLLESQPKARMPALWSVLDVGIVPLRNDPLFEGALPSKLFEAMGMGVPLLMSVPRGEATEFVEGARAGCSVQPENPTAMAEAITELAGQPDRLARMRSSALGTAAQHSRQSQSVRMIETFQRAIQRAVSR